MVCYKEVTILEELEKLKENKGPLMTILEDNTSHLK